MESKDHAFLDVSDSPIALINDELIVTYANRSFLQLAGASMQGGDAREAGEFFESIEPLMASIKFCKAVSGGIPCRLVFKSSGEYHRCNVKLVRGTNESLFMLEGMHRETDRFVSLNMQLMNLDHAMAKQAVILRRYKATNQGVENFMQSLIHDIRSPLSSIMMALEMVSERVAVDSDQESSNVLDAANRSVTRLMDFVDSLYENMVGLEGDLKLEDLDLAELLGDLKLDLAAQIKTTGASIDQDLEQRIVHADRALFRQLIQNLLQNALKFRDGARPLVVQIRSRSTPDSGILIDIQDNGIGFDQSIADGLFEKFYKADGDADGLGLGLATCKRIVELHGWSISAIGRPASGATFRVEIPRR